MHCNIDTCIERVPVFSSQCAEQASRAWCHLPSTCVCIMQGTLVPSCLARAVVGLSSAGTHVPADFQASAAVVGAMIETAAFGMEEVVCFHTLFAAPLLKRNLVAGRSASTSASARRTTPTLTATR